MAAREPSTRKAPPSCATCRHARRDHGESGDRCNRPECHCHGFIA